MSDPATEPSDAAVRDSACDYDARLSEGRGGFDRWLARVKREAKAEAWDEGARWAFEEITGEPENGFGIAPGDNPYRKAAE